MALIPLYGAREPIGMFDAADGYTFAGGEVVFLEAVLWNSSTDLAAADVTEDGYTGTTTKKRPAVAPVSYTGQGPVFLADEGTSNAYSSYGTLFGQVVGATAGQVVTGGAVLGPASNTGSGKCTIWRQPGFYGITLDAVSQDATNGLVPANASCTVGATVGSNTSGHLVLNQNSAALGNTTLGYFEEFLTNGSLVTTPVDLVAALNSPSGSVQSLSAKKFIMAVIYWTGGSTGSL